MRYILAITVALGFFAGHSVRPDAAHAASYKSLKAKGYRTRGTSGRRGWRVSGKDRYFCTLRGSMARNGNKAVSFTTSGRMIPLGRTTRKGLPKLSDLRAGRPRIRDVGTCRKLR